ncbi:TFIIH basal transcription factor complex TTD-A subunit [Enteropsectra breve]|nr:TFIIH basal transcription factor complex TTD-A subunit [Enteropsectra breve]
MVKVAKGTLVQTEPSIKEVISRIGDHDGSVLADINDETIFITREASLSIRESVNKIMGNKSS